MKALPEKYHATAAVSVVLIFVIVVISSLLFTWGIISATQSEVDARQAQLEALQRRAALPSAPANTEKGNGVEPFFGDSFGLAANDLQQRVVSLIESAGGTLTTVGVDPQVTADDESGRRVVVQAVAELTNGGLQELLYQLEAEAPLVFIDNLTVNRVTQRGAGETEEVKTSPRLSVDLRAAGYFKRPAP
jgi:hypothetical protein